MEVVIKTFHVTIEVTGKITVPDTTLRELRITAGDTPGEQGGDKRLHDLNKQFPDDDDAFLQAALASGLRNVVRNGLITDIGNMGVGCRAAPPVVTVSIPERVVTAVKAREQIAVDRLSVEQVEPSLNELAEKLDAQQSARPRPAN